MINHLKKCHTLMVGMVFLAGCASSYSTINPKQVNYGLTGSTDEINYSYKYNVLAEKGNRKYAKRETKYGVSVVALKIENTTSSPIVVNEDINFSIGGKEVAPLNSQAVTSSIRQEGIGFYAFYGLLVLYLYDGGTVTTIPIGVPIGLGNIIVASSANKNFEKEFNDNNIVGKTIQPGETLYGLAGFRDIQYGNLEMEMVD